MAATWADWVRGKREFDHPTWHYINYPIIEAGSAFKAADHEPPAKQENVVNQLAVCMEKIKTGTDEEKAIYMTWLFHLVGDIHQPLHCIAVYSERFPNGDRGGNLAIVRTRTSSTNLHSFWDGLPGRGMTVGDIGKSVQEIEEVMKDKAAEVKKELDQHQTFESWGREGLELSKRAVYLNGELKVAAGPGAKDAPNYQPTTERPVQGSACAAAQGRAPLGRSGQEVVSVARGVGPPKKR